jgi:hypothetical protein
MVFRGKQFWSFTFLVLLGLQQSCSKAPVLPPTAERVPEAEIPGRSTDKPREPDSASAKLGPPPPERPKPAGQPFPSEILPESVIVPPEKPLASPKINYETILTQRTLDPPTNAGWQYRKDRQSRIVGFELSNRGGNPILPPRHDIGRNLFFTRDFQFRFDDRARQDIHLVISDWPPSKDRQFRLSELMNSVLHFFPRRYLPAILRSNGRTLVTLPTGEQVEFDANTHEIVGGVFSEAPVDLNADRAARKFPAVAYLGQGLLVRADARGKDPRIGNMAVITTGAPPSNCQGESGCNQCRVPSQELWQQDGAVRFRFSSDSDFHRYLLARCGFGIPETEPNSTVASPLRSFSK